MTLCVIHEEIDDLFQLFFLNKGSSFNGPNLTLSEMLKGTAFVTLCGGGLMHRKLKKVRHG